MTATSMPTSNMAATSRHPSDSPSRLRALDRQRQSTSTAAMATVKETEQREARSRCRCISRREMSTPKTARTWPETGSRTGLAAVIQLPNAFR